MAFSRFVRAKAFLRGLRHASPFLELSAIELEKPFGKELTPELAKARDKHLEKILSRASVSDICRLLKRKFGLQEQHKLVEELEKRYWHLVHDILGSLIEYYVHKVDPKLLVMTIRGDVEERSSIAEWPGISITHEAQLIRKMHQLLRFRKIVKDLLKTEGFDPKIRIALSVLCSELSRETYDKMIREFLQHKIKRVLDTQNSKKSGFDRGIEH